MLRHFLASGPLKFVKFVKFVMSVMAVMLVVMAVTAVDMAGVGAGQPRAPRAAAARGTRPRPHDPSWVAPPAAAARINPLAGRSETTAGGLKLYRRRCSSCHGEDGRGTARAPDVTRPAVQAQSDGALFWKITNGDTRSGMPSFSFLPEPQRWQLVLQLRSWRGTNH